MNHYQDWHDIKIYVNWRFGKNLLSSFINFFSSASPCAQIKKISHANISQPCKWLKLLCFKKFCLGFIHANSGVWRSKFGPNSNTRDLLLNFVVNIFFYVGFLSRIFTIHRTARESWGYFFNSSLPLPPASQILIY